MSEQAALIVFQQHEANPWQQHEQHVIIISMIIITAIPATAACSSKNRMLSTCIVTPL
jgi:hypothetical protein